MLKARRRLGDGGLRYKPRRAFSEVLSTVILCTTLLTIMLVGTRVANDVLRNQMAATEFDSSKRLLASINSEIGTLIYKPGASANIKCGFSYTAPGYTLTGGTMGITFSNGTDSEEFNVDVNTLNMETIPGVGGRFDYTFQGSDSLIVPSYSNSFGRIYISKPLNWRAALDYERAQYTYSGTSKLFDGSTLRTYNIVEVTVLEMEFGEFETTDNPIITLQNTDVSTSTFTLENSWTMTVTGTNGNLQKTLADISLNQANPNNPTFFEFSVVHLKVTVLGGD